MDQRPHTAPESKTLKSKFISNRTNAVKEIEAWVKGDGDYRQRDAVRMSGQLTENITEDRMLKAKLWELSRERYKFLSQSAYEKKVFIDRTQRKSSAGRQATILQERIGSSQSSAKRSKPNARMAMLARLDPTKSRDRPKQFVSKSFTDEGTDVKLKRTKSVHFRQSLPRQDTSNHMAERQVTRALSQQNLMRADSLHRNISKTESERSLPIIFKTSVPRFEASQRTTVFNRPVESTPVSAWARKRTRSASIVSSNASSQYVRHYTDPRITRLESSLAPIHVSSSCSDVSSIVKQIASLHLPPRINKETTKPKTAVKILEHIKAKGLIT